MLGGPIVVSDWAILASESFTLTAIIGKDSSRRSGRSVAAPGAHLGGPGEWVDHADTLCLVRLGSYAELGHERGGHGELRQA